MKLRKKLLIILFAVILPTLLFYNREEKPCCLCGSFRYHAPCLIDLETGALIGLDLYFPHETKVAELADPQPEMGVLVFDGLGSVKVVKDTIGKTAEFSVPRWERTTNLVLCRECRKQIGLLPMRYVLADLYDGEDKNIIPIRAGLSVELRCYEITAQKGEKKNLNVIIQGKLE